MVQAFKTFLTEAKNADKVAKEIAQMTDDNDHTGAAIELAKYLGDKDALETLNAIDKKSQRAGHSDHADITKRDSLVKELLKKLPKNEYAKFHAAF